MTISYNWLSEYLPEVVEPERLSKILTAIGLEVESMTPFSAIKGNLAGLVIGEVMTKEKHPDADKLSLTTVNIGNGETLNIVCGAPNVAAGQKVVVATVGTTIYPLEGDPLTMKKAKIRGHESMGMICAEDEIGLGHGHDGIMILPADTVVGTAAADYFKPYHDIIYEIGLTPNRMDAMSHLGVAKDVCAYLTYHDKKDVNIKSPFKNNFKVDHQGLQIKVTVDDVAATPRYAGVSIQGITVAESPAWLQNKLKAIDLRPINNVVDITNYILHETGQPLHAFDADKIVGGHVQVKHLAAGTLFTTLDDKERKLQDTDIMICDGEATPMCIGGVFGGLSSGVTAETKNIFLEAAWFNPISIRRTSLHHGLRTDAATRFEKGVDISNTVNVLKRAAMLIREVAGGEIASDIVDHYPSPKEKTEVALKFHYLKKLSGKNYHPDAVRSILSKLGFELMKEGADDIRVAVPHHKPDISIPADLVEEIMRIDGLDNVEIPQFIQIAPATETLATKFTLQEKVSNNLVGLGFNEIFTNSITNSAFFDDDTLKETVKMMNNLSAELDVMRPSMLETGLQSVAHNVNRKNNNLKLFEFGKTYHTPEAGQYKEHNVLSILISGDKSNASWSNKAQKADMYFAKGVAEKIFHSLSLEVSQSIEGSSIVFAYKNNTVATVKEVSASQLKQHDIKQVVFYVEMNWDKLVQYASKQTISFKEISKFPAVQRDLALVVDKAVQYQQIEQSAKQLKIGKLKDIGLFDIFESEKLGANKKSMAVSFTFLDEEKTLTDKEVDSMVNKIIGQLEKDVNAEIRK